MRPEKMNQLKDLLASKGITPVAFGVTSGSNEEEWNQLFEFAQDLGIEVITSEPNFGDLDMIESLCKKYNIKVGIHNQPIPTRSWHPKISLSLLVGRRELIVIVADVEH